jgi:hypothetical protein
MNRSTEQQIIVLTRRLQELEAALNRSGAERVIRASRLHRAGSILIGASVLVVATAILGAQAPASPSADLEQRLRVLESLLRRGAGNTVQISAPLEVVSPDGKALLRVASAPDYKVPVSIAVVPSSGGGLVSINAGGVAQAVISASSGRGEFAALDAKEITRAALLGTGGVVVFDPSGEQLVAMTNGDANNGRIGIWRGTNRVIDITTDPAAGGSGLLSINTNSGQSIARLATVDSAGELVLSNANGARSARLGSSGGAGALSVMNASGTAVAGLLGTAAGGGAVAVAHSTGGTVAEMSVSGEGRGLFQVFARGGGRALAVLTQATDRVGGLLQISNASTTVANLTVGNQGAGYLQLADPSGSPTVEAGTLPNGKGQVRAGPLYKCIPVQAATPVLSVGLPDCILGGTQ